MELIEQSSMTSAAKASQAISDTAPQQPMARISRWPALIGGVLTAAMVAGLAHQLLGAGLAGLSHAVPRSGWFYVAFAAFYMTLPLSDYAIFRRLWGLPIDGLAALMKKRIANEVVFSYSGEALFYAWARQRVTRVSAPFGAVKDVSILSAIAGNAMTLATIAAALPFAHALLSQRQLHLLATSGGVMVAMSLPFLIFSKRVFALPRRELWVVFAIHLARLVVETLLIAVTWHFGAPQIALGTWLVLAATRLLVSRLPLVPNKDLLFANVAILLVGQDKHLTALIAFTAALTLAVHVVLMAGFGLWGLARRYV